MTRAGEATGADRAGSYARGCILAVAALCLICFVRSVRGDAGATEAATASEAPTGTGLVYHEDYLKHRTRPGHPERPERLTAILEHLEQTGLYEQLTLIEPAPAAIEWIAQVHSPEYIRSVERTCKAGGILDSGDTPVSRESYAVARLAVGGVLAAADAVMGGEVRNAFCLVRPPGHHATRDRGMGFCIFNNVAIAARYLQQHHGLQRILIVDWDVHHGNGTQEAFYDDPTVMYFGVHQYPFYPGTGGADERGSGPGEGFTINVPLPAGSGGAEFLAAFEDVLAPAAEEFKPDFILVSAGFDAHADDPLAGMRLTAEDFRDLARVVKTLTEKHCEGRLVAVLEGGYDLEALSASVAEVLRAFLSEDRP